MRGRGKEETVWLQHDECNGNGSELECVSEKRVCEEYTVASYK